MSGLVRRGVGPKGGLGWSVGWRSYQVSDESLRRSCPGWLHQSWGSDVVTTGGKGKGACAQGGLWLEGSRATSLGPRHFDEKSIWRNANGLTNRNQRQIILTRFIVKVEVRFNEVKSNFENRDELLKTTTNQTVSRDFSSNGFILKLRLPTAFSSI